MKPLRLYLIRLLPTFFYSALSFPGLSLAFAIFFSKCLCSNSSWKASTGIKSEMKLLFGAFFRASLLESTYIGIEMKDFRTDRDLSSFFVKMIIIRLNLFRWVELNLLHDWMRFKKISNCWTSQPRCCLFISWFRPQDSLPGDRIILFSWWDILTWSSSRRDWCPTDSLLRWGPALIFWLQVRECSSFYARWSLPLPHSWFSFPSWFQYWARPRYRPLPAEWCTLTRGSRRLGFGSFYWLVWWWGCSQSTPILYPVVASFLTRNKYISTQRYWQSII